MLSSAGSRAHGVTNDQNTEGLGRCCRCRLTLPPEAEEQACETAETQGKESSTGVIYIIPYALGYPNANCIGCCRATSPAYWRLVKRTFPDVFADRAKQSRELGARLVRVEGKRLFLDELTDENEAKGGQMMMDFECNVFCEEPARPAAIAAGA